MTVQELIEELQKLPPTAKVILQRDAEGNGYSPLAVVDGEAIYVADTSYSGEVYSADASADEHDMSEEDWATMLLTQPRCVVLAPTN